MAAQGLPPYKYQPIDAQNEIRVLSLPPSPNFFDPLEGRLLRRHLFWTDQALVPPPYEAVSYCWGGLPTSLILKCDAQNLTITQNVDSVLRHLRKASEARILWVDALSINQADVKEKGKQVQNMGMGLVTSRVIRVTLSKPLSTKPWRGCELLRIRGNRIVGRHALKRCQCCRQCGHIVAKVSGQRRRAVEAEGVGRDEVNGDNEGLTGWNYVQADVGIASANVRSLGRIAAGLSCPLSYQLFMQS